jgi:hypothetical protein
MTSPRHASDPSAAAPAGPAKARLRTEEDLAPEEGWGPEQQAALARRRAADAGGRGGTASHHGDSDASAAGELTAELTKELIKDKKAEDAKAELDEIDETPTNGWPAPPALAAPTPAAVDPQRVAQGRDKKRQSGSWLAFTGAAASLASGTLSAGPAASSTRYEAAIPAFASAAANLAIVIAAIENPAAQWFTISATVLWSNDGETARAVLGLVTPQPPDRPGTFFVRLPPAVRELLTRRGGQLRLLLELVPVSADAPLREPVALRIGSPRWQ